jgi:predicted Zn-dependent protease
MTNPSSRLKTLLTASAALALVLTSLTAQEDVVVLVTGDAIQGEVVRVADGNISIQMGAAGQRVTATRPLSQIRSVTKDPPAAFDQAIAEWQKGDAASAKQKITPLVETFLGLPTTWARRAALLLADAQIETGDVAGATQSLQAFEAAYPDSSDMAALTKAKIAIAGQNFAEAKNLLAPIVAKGEQTRLADSAESVTFGQAFYLMGQIREAEGAHSEALQDYLRTSTLFFEDSVVASRAEERANFLVTEKNAVVP